jgi:hypothetical protein
MVNKLAKGQGIWITINGNWKAILPHSQSLRVPPLLMAAGGGLPILLPYAVVVAMGASLTTKQRTLAQMLNESLANSDTSFSGFISLLPKPSAQISKGSYCVSFYDPIKSFWVQRDYYYNCGIMWRKSYVGCPQFFSNPRKIRRLWQSKTTIGSLSRPYPLLCGSKFVLFPSVRFSFKNPLPPFHWSSKP